MAGLRQRLVPVRDSAVGNRLRQMRSWIAPGYQSLKARYQKLEPREKRLVQIGGAMLAIFLGYNLIYVPITSLQSGLEEEIAARQRDLGEVRRMKLAYQRLETELAEQEKQTAPPGKDFSLSTVISGAISGSVEPDKIAGIFSPQPKPVSDQFTQYSADLKLTNVALKQLVDVLFQIKSLKVPVVVSNLNINRRAQDPHTYDVEITCSVLGKNA